MSSIDWPAVGAIATAITCAVVVWYTVETQKLRRLSERQIELLVRPFVVARFNDGKLYVKNIGKGSAFNVTVESVELLDDVPRPTKYLIGFPEPVSALEPGQESLLRPFAERNGMRVPPGELETLMSNLNTQLTQSSFTLAVEYNNLDGMHYRTQIEVGPGTWKILPMKAGGAGCISEETRMVMNGWHRLFVLACFLWRTR
jgi:hypothetical protein